MAENPKLLTLMAAQLKFLGYFTAAKIIQDALNTKIEPSNKLETLLKSVDYANDLEDKALETSEDFKFDPNQSSKQPPNPQIVFSTQHRESCRAACFSQDGTFLATGSHDTSLKVLDVQAMHKKGDDEKQVIKTLYDHQLPVNEVCFHPNGVVLASCSGFFVNR